VVNLEYLHIISGREGVVSEEKIKYGKKCNLLIRFALWDVWENKCWICEELKLFQEIQIDHVIPRTISEDRLSTLKAYHSLADEFDVDGLENLAPACVKCNKNKSDESRLDKPVITMTLLKIGDRMRRVENKIRDIQSNRGISKALQYLYEVNLRNVDNQKLLTPIIRDITEGLHYRGVEIRPRVRKEIYINAVAKKYFDSCNVQILIEGNERFLFDYVETVCEVPIDECFALAIEELSENFNKDAEGKARAAISEGEYNSSGNSSIDFSSFSCIAEKVEILSRVDAEYSMQISGRVSGCLSISRAIDLTVVHDSVETSDSFLHSTQSFECEGEFSLMMSLKLDLLKTIFPSSKVDAIEMDIYAVDEEE
jgi:hypothetical protein